MPDHSIHYLKSHFVYIVSVPRVGPKLENFVKYHVKNKAVMRIKKSIMYQWLQFLMQKRKSERFTLMKSQMHSSTRLNISIFKYIL